MDREIPLRSVSTSSDIRPSMSDLDKPPELASKYGRVKISELKLAYPSKSDWIDVQVRRYLSDPGPPADDEFVHSLERSLKNPSPR